MENGTNDVPPNYVVGQLVRLLIPPKNGARQLNGQSGFVLSLPSSSEVEVAINSVECDPFIPNPTFFLTESQTQPQILSIGDISGGQINSSGRINLGTTIPGAFQNIS